MDKAIFTPNEEHIIKVLLKKNEKLEEGILRKAIAFIADAHDGQYRKSGMPYTEHPFEVNRRRYITFFDELYLFRINEIR